MIDSQRSDDVIFWVQVFIILAELGLLAVGMGVPPDSQIIL